MLQIVTPLNIIINIIFIIIVIIIIEAPSDSEEWVSAGGGGSVKGMAQMSGSTTRARFCLSGQFSGSPNPHSSVINFICSPPSPPTQWSGTPGHPK